MQSRFIIVAMLLVALAAFALAQEYTPLSEAEMKKLFVKFSKKHAKLYGAEDHGKRYQIFKSNVEKARYYNHVGKRETFGVSKFMDLTPEEFKRMFLMKTYTPEEARKILAAPKEAVVTAQQVKDTPTSWDWRQKGAVTPVKNQGACGSCWTFSTTGNVEGIHQIKTGKLVSLSEQQLVDCDHNCVTYQGQQACDAGCNGGLMWSAFQYVIKTGGLVTEDSYPYEGVDDTCRFNKSNVAVTINSWTSIPSDEGKMAAWLAANGPISIAINAEWLQTYTSGISNPWFCNPQDLDHGVLIVGFGTGSNWLGEKEDYWIIKNSWGADWGESGYFRIVRGKGKCGLNSVPSSSLI
ncbi:cysteine protease [Naegleria gruberi]|uniref:Cysteine protease n=1 Tax=Naegleria gruberi TaxID=5762 RepID=D2V355_NAEGR|nr:cysteine protease [Naegleria gruberi]EFC48573.1 cysteine protease [Naegleria gruberi]|eukprot:XP_002681317.1 cysteine protease [Naegleria gruberi strain NEG-M]